MKFNKLIIVIFFAQLLIYSCSSSPYDKLVNRESSKTIVLDSLVFDFHFGDTKKYFFQRCMALNKQELIKEGPNNKFVQYTLEATGENESPIQMLFYGIFNKENIMTGMDMRFSYNFWSAWSDEYSAQKLIPQLKDTLINWYPGNDFIPVKIPNNEGAVFVKIDANRQILMYAIDTKDVVVKIEDLRIKYPSKYK